MCASESSASRFDERQFLECGSHLPLSDEGLKAPEGWRSPRRFANLYVRQGRGYNVVHLGAPFFAGAHFEGMRFTRLAE
jgi:hypothetical protein